MAVDDLFDGREVIVVDPLPRLRQWLYWTGLMVLGGPCCCSGPIGALAAIWVWARAGDEIERADSGLGPEGTAAGARSLRNQAFGLMVVSMLSLIVQCLGFALYASLLKPVLSWVQEQYSVLTDGVPLSTTAMVVSFLVVGFVISSVLGTVNLAIRQISERAVFGSSSPRRAPPRRPLPPVPHETMQAYIDKEQALRDLYPEAVVLHPELGALPDEQRYTVGEWPLGDGPVVPVPLLVLPAGLTFLAVVVLNAAAAPEVLWREAAWVLKVLGPRVVPVELPCPHLRVQVEPEERSALVAALRKLPEYKP